MSRNRKIILIVAALLALYALIGFVVVPWILESMVPEKLSVALNRPVSVENIRLNPFALTAGVEGLDIRDKTGNAPFVSFEEAFVNIQTLSLFKLALVVKEARLVKPAVHIVRTDQTEFNFSDLIPEKKFESTPPSPETPKKPFMFSISNIAIVEGKISFQDTLVQKSHVLSALNFTLPHISNFEKHIETFSEPLLTAEFNAADISIDTDTKPFHDTLKTIIDLKITGLEIPYYFAYVPKDKVNFDIHNGRLDVTAKILYSKAKAGSDVTVSGAIGLAGLEILDRAGGPVITLPGLQVDVAPSRPLENRLSLAQVKIQAPELFVSRAADGVISLTTLTPVSDPVSEPPASPETKPEPEKTASESPFVLEIHELVLDSGKLAFTDHAATTPDASPTALSVNDLKIHLSEFSTEPGKTAAYDIHAQINGEAPISLAGTLGTSPLSVESDFSIKGVKLAWGQPYVPETISLVITDGKFSATGHAGVRAADTEAFQATVSGKTEITDFDSVDVSRNERFVSWRAFSINGINISTSPLKIHLDQIRLAELKNQVVLFEDGASNIQKIFTASASSEKIQTPPPAVEAPQTAPEEPVPPISIGEVLLENCEFAFIDQSIRPHFSTRLDLTELRITGLTSEDFQTAVLTAKGAIDNHAPLTIEGSLNPLKKDPFLDLAVDMSNMELSTLSPYTGTYIGRAIAKGKLSTELSYKIENKALNAQNRVLLDQFTLGQTVESKDALNLPVGLAVSLLKDREGKIQVDLPISGRTDDPEFKFGKALLKTLTNLIVKAAASPFDLVASVVSGGEELRYIEFEPAAIAITASADEKLSAIAKLLYERPGLNLDIAGYIDPKADREGLRQRMLDRKLKIRYLGKDASKDLAQIDAIVVPSDRYPVLMKQIYTEALSADPEKKETMKPANDPSLTVEEMAAAILSEISVPDAELRLLAQERSRAVKDQLLADGKISPDRIFISEPETLSPSGNDAFKAARVELNLR